MTVKRRLSLMLGIRSCRERLKWNHLETQTTRTVGGSILPRGVGSSLLPPRRA